MTRIAKPLYAMPKLLDLGRLTEALGNCVGGSTADPGEGVCYGGQQTSEGQSHVCINGQDTHSNTGCATGSSGTAHACVGGGNTITNCSSGTGNT